MEITSEKKTAIKKLLKVTNITQSSEAIMNLFIDQIITASKKDGNSVNPRTFETDRTFNLMKEEAKLLIHEEVVIKKSFHLLIYLIYHKYLTLKEINELIKFYETPLGQKIISTAPKMMQESTKIGQI